MAMAKSWWRGPAFSPSRATGRLCTGCAVAPAGLSMGQTESISPSAFVRGIRAGLKASCCARRHRNFLRCNSSTLMWYPVIRWERALDALPSFEVYGWQPRSTPQLRSLRLPKSTSGLLRPDTPFYRRREVQYRIRQECARTWLKNSINTKTTLTS